MKRGHPVQAPLPRERLRVDQRRLEIVAMLEQLGAEGAHRDVLLRAVAVRDHDDGLQPVPGGGEGHRLAVVSPGRPDDSPHARLPRGQPGNVMQRASDLE